MTKRFIVGIDGSDASLTALTWATGFAERHEAEVVPVHSWEYPTIALLPSPVGFPVPAQAFMTQTNDRLITKLIDDHREQIENADCITDPEVYHGGPASVLCEAAKDADLIVVGSRERGRFKGLMLGSVGSQVVNAAPCAVAVIPSDWTPTSTGRVVIGVDGSPHSNAAVDWADRWAPPPSTLHLVHGWEIPVSLEGFDRWIDSTDVEGAAKRLTELGAERVVDHQVETEVIQANMKQSLTECARDADLLVLGARGHSKLVGLLLGSVTTSTLNHLTGPTVIVRAE
ncbi:MAG: universal stress protein [Acidimicrobiales bacterium]|nr:universal stress protein [Acidimicrobiales bacterium]